MQISSRSTTASSACAYLRNNCAVRQTHSVKFKPLASLHAAAAGMPFVYMSASKRTKSCCVLFGGLGLQAAQLQELVQAVHGLPRLAEPLRQLGSHPAQREGHARAPACALL